MREMKNSRERECGWIQHATYQRLAFRDDPSRSVVQEYPRLLVAIAVLCGGDLQEVGRVVCVSICTVN